MKATIIFTFTIWIIGASIRFAIDAPIFQNGDNSSETYRSLVDGDNAFLEMTNGELFIIILKQNLSINLALMLGFLSLGIANVLIIGYHSYNIAHHVIVSLKSGLSSHQVFLFLAPHGILESLSMIMASGVGLFVLRNFKSLFADEFKKETVIKLFKISLSIIVLTILAAFIEAFFTLKIMKEYALSVG